MSQTQTQTPGPTSPDPVVHRFTLGAFRGVVVNIVDPFVKTLGRGNLRWRHLLSPADWQGCVNR